MNTYKKPVLIVCFAVVFLLALFLLYSLLADKEDGNIARPDDMHATGNEDASPVPTRLVVIDGNPGKNNDTKTELITLRYYSVSSTNSANQTAEVMIEAEKEITPELIMEYLMDSLEDEEILLKVNKITLEDMICNIDFDSSINYIAEDSAVTEVHILDAFAMSILDNCENVKGVSFTINGQRYKTMNITFSEGEVYLSD